MKLTEKNITIYLLVAIVALILSVNLPAIVVSAFNLASY